VDKLNTSEGWKKLHDVAAEEGIVAIAYERKQGEFSRLYQFGKVRQHPPDRNGVQSLMRLVSPWM